MARCECYDYPVSWTYYRSHCITEHGFDPGSNVPEEDVHVIDYSFEEADPNYATVLKQLDRIRAQMVYNQNKVNEHIDRPKKGGKSAF